MRPPERPDPPSGGATATSPAWAGGAVARLELMLPILAGRLPALLDEVRTRFARDWPEYAAFLAEEHDEVAGAAEAFLRWLVRTAEDGRGAASQPEAQQALFEEIGRNEWRAGRDVSSLLSAYQVGARVAWHHVSAAALDAGVPPPALAALAEGVFVFVDQLSSASARGFVLEQSEAAGSRERLRDELVELLLSDRSDSVAVRAAAVRAGWPLPRAAAVLLVDPANPVGQAMLARLDSSCLVIRRRSLHGAVVPDPVRPGRRQRLTTALRGTGAVVGHPVPLDELPFSAQVAEVAVALRTDGVLTDDPVFAEEHLDAIIVHRDERLLEALRAQVLAPLRGVAPAVRERLCETLASWLRHLGDRQAVAAELHIHPQTVRYRMSQLHELFGPALDEPDVRRRLTLVLAWGSGSAPPEGRSAAEARRRAGTGRTGRRGSQRR